MLLYFAILSNCCLGRLKNKTMQFLTLSGRKAYSRGPLKSMSNELPRRNCMTCLLLLPFFV